MPFPRQRETLLPPLSRASGKGEETFLQAAAIPVHVV